MTSAISHSDRRGRGFSLVELLVVIGIIIVLAGFALPMVIKAYSQAERNKNQMDLRTIAVALDAYKHDFGDIPRPNPGTPAGRRGAVLLAHALVGPGGVEIDGLKGNGFKLRKLVGADTLIDTADDVGQGKTWGPYIQLERIKVGGTEPTQTLQTKDGKDILYYATNPGVTNTTTLNGYVHNAGSPLIRSDDNSEIANRELRVLLGDFGTNGAIDEQFPHAKEVQYLQSPYLLVTPGADGTYGPPTSSTVNGTNAANWNINKNAAAACDDITNLTK